MSSADPAHPAVPSPHKAEWATLQELAIRYLFLGDGPAHALERSVLRDRICAHLAGVFFVCLDALANGDDESKQDAGARLERRDSKLEKLIKEELRRHRLASGGQRALQAAHGGTDAFAPIAAQNFLQERSLRAPPGASFLTAMLSGWDSKKGTLEGFMRECVKHFLADMAAARRPRRRHGSAHIPKNASPQEAVRRQALYEQLQALYRGEAPLLEEQTVDGGDEEAIADERAELGHSATDLAVELRNLRRVVDQALGWMDPLNVALLRQEMGWEPEEEGKVLAQRFGVSPSAVSQRRDPLIRELRRALGVKSSD